MRWAAACVILGATCTLGCVERRFVVTTDPFGAVVYDHNDQPISAAPADKSFQYYGNYRFKLVKDGYRTKIVEEKIQAPWYQWPGLDFVSENLIPWTIRDIRRLHYTLEPLAPESPEKVRADGEALRQRGQSVGPHMAQ